MDVAYRATTMFLSILLYCGLSVALTGMLSVIHPLRFLHINTRMTGAGVAFAGIAIVLIVMLLPASEKRVATRASRLDELMPVWQFNEKHEIAIDATPERVFEAVRAVKANEIFLFHTLVAIRRFGRPGPESILNPGDNEPLLSVATRTSFVLLAEEPPRELVVGTVVMAPKDLHRGDRLSAELFNRTLRPGVGLAAMNFLVTPDGHGGSLLTTETRVYMNTPATVRRFAAYWRVILPGSAIIRRMWLRAIKRRAMEE